MLAPSPCMLDLIPLTVIFAYLPIPPPPSPRRWRVGSLSGPLQPCYPLPLRVAGIFNEPVDCGLVQTKFVFKRVKRGNPWSGIGIGRDGLGMLKNPTPVGARVEALRSNYEWHYKHSYKVTTATCPECPAGRAENQIRFYSWQRTRARSTANCSRPGLGMGLYLCCVRSTTPAATAAHKSDQKERERSVRQHNEIIKSNEQQAAGRKHIAKSA